MFGPIEGGMKWSLDWMFDFFFLKKKKALFMLSKKKYKPLFSETYLVVLG